MANGTVRVSKQLRPSRSKGLRDNVVSKQAQDFYCKMYPEVSCRRVAKVLRKVKSQVGRLDAITVDWFMRPERARYMESLSKMFGGKR